MIWLSISSLVGIIFSPCSLNLFIRALLLIYFSNFFLSAFRPAFSTCAGIINSTFICSKDKFVVEKNLKVKDCRSCQEFSIPESWLKFYDFEDFVEDRFGTDQKLMRGGGREGSSRCRKYILTEIQRESL
ncbi:predicted protein [Methanosarcina acetivorans C2A]|uniref:Uncharacterized protein n=1 Tax=Methanosarcina acetivorans (strain ATCC 35395 / DSM 2834 / JCM 12185 / C2A) TaxID=188937 RepID=Q8TKI4_METAC|nr:predicted protein [Methanosarcina acetivorans C2A]